MSVQFKINKTIFPYTLKYIFPYTGYISGLLAISGIYSSMKILFRATLCEWRHLSRVRKAKTFRVAKFMI